jgi:putative transcriptional regulator
MRKKKPSRPTKALLEIADDMRRVGIMDSVSHEKITLRQLGKADIVGTPIIDDDDPPDSP